VRSGTPLACTPDRFLVCRPQMVSVFLPLRRRARLALSSRTCFPTVDCSPGNPHLHRLAQDSRYLSSIGSFKASLRLELRILVWSSTMIDPAIDSAFLVRSYLLYFIPPLWMLAGLTDYFLHKRMRIEDTSGTRESVLHLLQLVRRDSAHQSMCRLRAMGQRSLCASERFIWNLKPPLILSRSAATR
jgi:hypothetical protein